MTTHKFSDWCKTAGHDDDDDDDALFIELMEKLREEIDIIAEEARCMKCFFQMLHDLDIPTDWRIPLPEKPCTIYDTPEMQRNDILKFPDLMYEINRRLRCEKCYTQLLIMLGLPRQWSYKPLLSCDGHEFVGYDTVD